MRHHLTRPFIADHTAGFFGQVLQSIVASSWYTRHNQLQLVAPVVDIDDMAETEVLTDHFRPFV